MKTEVKILIGDEDGMLSKEHIEQIADIPSWGHSDLKGYIDGYVNVNGNIHAAVVLDLHKKIIMAPLTAIKPTGKISTPTTRSIEIYEYVPIIT